MPLIRPLDTCHPRQQLVDKMHVYVAPKIFGDQDALSAVTGLHPADINRLIQLRKLDYRKIGTDILVTAYPTRMN